MSRSKYINTFETTAEYDNYIESAYPEFPNVGYDKQAGVVNIRRQSPNDYQIWGTTTATENFNIKLNNTNVEVTVDPVLGEFYLTGWTGTLTRLYQCFAQNDTITSIKKFALDTSNVTTFEGFLQDSSINNFSFINLNNILSTSSLANFFRNCSNITYIDFYDLDLSNNDVSAMFYYNNDTSFPSTLDIYIQNENTLNKLTNNLTKANKYGYGTDTRYIPSIATIHYNNGTGNVDYKWQNDKWTPQS